MAKPVRTAVDITHRIPIVRRTLVLSAPSVADAFGEIDRYWGGQAAGNDTFDTPHAAVTDELEFDAEGHRFKVSIRPLEDAS